MTASAPNRPLTVVIGSRQASFLRMASRVLEAYPEVAVAGVASTASEVALLAVDHRPQVVVLGEELAGDFSAVCALQTRAVDRPALIVLTDDEWPAASVHYVRRRNLGSELLPAIRRAAQPLIGEHP